MAFRGLTVFIADVRAAKSKEAERKRVEQELANIRKKFRSNKTLDAYNKKKYVAKLVFCVLLGYEFDFGHMEAVELLSGATYGEKQMGYLFTSVLMNENHDLSTLLINSIQTDLTGRNEVFACLGLAAVANTGGKEMAEALAPTVQKLLFRSSSGGSRPFVQKKAALCLLRLYRRWPDCIPPGELTDRILGLLDSNNLGVVTASMALIQALVADEPEDYAGCVRKVIWLLDRIIIKREYPNDYVYKGVACPWLCVKLMRVLQYYPPPRDRDVMERLTHVLQTIVNNSDTAQDPKDTNHNNAYNAVLFEAIDLMIHLDSEPELLIQCAHLLGQFIRAPETNIRYLGLEKMAHLARSNEDSLDSLKRNQDVVIQSLKDNDISIRRRALDLLYHMCDRSSSAEIVTEMLAYLEVADHAIKDELVLKIAILAEKFAASWEWYVSTILELIALGGNYVSKEVWWRVVQIVTNNEDLQVFACRKVFEALQSPACHEVAIKVAGFLLGEFGHLLNEDPRSTVEQQFDLLHGKWGTIRGDTKAILLNAFSKYSNLFPEMQPLVLPVLRAHEAHINAELQQRACEYITLAEGDETLIAAVWDVMPAFPERDSAVIVAANRAAQEGMTDRGSAVNTTEISHEAEEVPVVLSAGNAAVEGSAPQPVGGGGLIDAGPSTGGSGGGSGGGLVDLLTGDVGGSNKTGSSAAGSGAPPITELLAGDSGVLFDDGGVQIGMKAEYRMHQARVELYHGNRTSANLNNFSAECSAVEGLSVRLQEIEGVGAGQQVVQLLALEATSVFQGHPVLKVCYNGQEHTVPVPVVAMKFITPYELDATKYLAGWNSLGADAEVQWFVSLPGAPDVEGLSTFLSTAFHLAVLPGIDPNTANLVSCGMFCGADAKIPVMLRVQTNAERQMACFTLRCTQPLIRAQVKGTVVANVGPETTL